jgi:hypothetical protein
MDRLVTAERRSIFLGTEPAKTTKAAEGITLSRLLPIPGGDLGYVFYFI